MGFIFCFYLGAKRECKKFALVVVVVVVEVKKRKKIRLWGSEQTWVQGLNSLNPHDNHSDHRFLCVLRTHERILRGTILGTQDMMMCEMCAWSSPSPFSLSVSSCRSVEQVQQKRSLKCALNVNCSLCWCLTPETNLFFFFLRRRRGTVCLCVLERH